MDSEKVNTILRKVKRLLQRRIGPGFPIQETEVPTSMDADE